MSAETVCTTCNGRGHRGLFGDGCEECGRKPSKFSVIEAILTPPMCELIMAAADVSDLSYDGPQMNRLRAAIDQLLDAIRSAPDVFYRPPSRPADERIQALEAMVARLTTERDLAIAHDTQPYPTAWAYEQACAALHAAKAELARLRHQPVEEADLWLAFRNAFDEPPFDFGDLTLDALADVAIEALAVPAVAPPTEEEAP
jgi:hypothetical protein